MTSPRIVIAGTNSGSGKTTMTMGLLSALRARGLAVQPFKAGPDYIDPGFHSLAAGRPCRNLDSMLLSRDRLLELFERASGKADISVVEGVMGLFDGAGHGDERGSTAHLARILSAPVLLVINGRGLSRSAAAMARGFAEFDRRIAVKGVLLNNIGSLRHYEAIRRPVEEEAGIPVFGHLPRSGAIAIPERHLGLVPAAGGEEMERFLDRLRSMVEDHVDVNRIVDAARTSPPLPRHGCSLFMPSPSVRKTRVAVALDEAFHFYYQDNLDILEHLGAELLPFSPLRDSSLPRGTGGIYIGGGFPEEFAPLLSANHSLREEIRAASEAGMPILAECGGLMYLAGSLEDRAGREHPMAGVFPGTVRMGKKLQALGYCEGRLTRKTLLGRKGSTLLGHVFHWSSYDSGGNDRLFSMEIEKDGKRFADGLAKKNSFASYLHIHFGTRPSLAGAFLGRIARGRSFPAKEEEPPEEVPSN